MGVKGKEQRMQTHMSFYLQSTRYRSVYDVHLNHIRCIYWFIGLYLSFFLSPWMIFFVCLSLHALFWAVIIFFWHLYSVSFFRFIYAMCAVFFVGIKRAFAYFATCFTTQHNTNQTNKYNVKRNEKMNEKTEKESIICKTDWRMQTDKPSTQFINCLCWPTTKCTGVRSAFCIWLITFCNYKQIMQ